MKIGVIFPTNEIGTDPVVIRDFAQAVDDLGYNHLAIFDHVIGADPSRHKLVGGPYTHEYCFHEPLVLMGFLAGVTRQIEFATEILIAPQRQTVLLAKQIAQAEVLSQGRVRLGLGLGWNHVEFEALGEDFTTRGKRFDEQLKLMRELWSKELVTFDGQWDKITHAGINPRPGNRIPIWMGGVSHAMLKRIGREGEGWITVNQPDEDCRQMIEALYQYTEEAGRDRSEVGIESWVCANNVNIFKGKEQTPEERTVKSPDQWQKELQAWKDIGASHVCCSTQHGQYSLEEHIRILRQFKEIADSL